MVRETEGREKSTSREAQTIRSVQRLSSRLQRAITSGRSSPKLLKDLDELISGTFASRMESILSVVEELASKDNPKLEPNRRADFVQLVPRMKNLQDTFRSMNQTYSSTLRGRRRVSTDDLTTLVELDSELGTSLVHLLHNCSMMRSSRRRSGENEIQEIYEILESIDDHMLARTDSYLLSQ